MSESDYQSQEQRELDSELLKKCKSVVTGLLQRRDYTGYELKTKLYQKVGDQPNADTIINQVLEEFSSLNLQSDFRAAIMLLSHGYKSGWGPNKINAQMQNKGIDGSIIEQLWSDVYAVSDKVNNLGVCDNSFSLCDSPRLASKGSSDKKFACHQPIEISQERLEITQNPKINKIAELQALIDAKQTGSETLTVENKLSQTEKKTSYLDYIGYNQSYDFNNLAKEQALKKFGKEFSHGQKNNIDWQTKAKVQRFLYNRGFLQEQIEFAISSMCDLYETS